MTWVSALFDIFSLHVIILLRQRPLFQAFCSWPEVRLSSDKFGPDWLLFVSCDAQSRSGRCVPSTLWMSVVGSGGAKARWEFLFVAFEAHQTKDLYLFITQEHPQKKHDSLDILVLNQLCYLGPPTLPWQVPQDVQPDSTRSWHTELQGRGCSCLLHGGGWS